MGKEKDFYLRDGVKQRPRGQWDSPSCILSPECQHLDKSNKWMTPHELWSDESWPLFWGPLISVSLTLPWGKAAQKLSSHILNGITNRLRRVMTVLEDTLKANHTSPCHSTCGDSHWKILVILEKLMITIMNYLYLLFANILLRYTH